MKNAVTIHFHSREGSYFDFNLWKWRDGELGKDAFFTSFDSFGLVAHLDFEAPYFLNHVYVIVKKHYWHYKTKDYRIERAYGLPKTEVWLVDGDDTVYYSRQAAIASHCYKNREAHAFDMAVNSRAFDKKWGFSGWLGFSYSQEKTEFRLWAPTALAVEIVLFSSTAEHASVSAVYPMMRGEHEDRNNHSQNTHGLWFISLKGDLNYQAYMYRVHYRKRTFKDTRDPYTIATTAKGKRSIVIAPEHLRPEGFSVKQKEDAWWRLDNANQAVIYEMHVRDFSVSETSGVSVDNRGKFKGLFEEGTRNPYGDPSAFDYVKDLGVTHIQLQPLFDHHQTLLEDGSYAYNWGYDPENYNVPDASFTSNPDEPATRILELKEAIQAYHNAGISVIMDVVYNHTYSSRDSAFQLTVPDYYYRMNPDGSFQNGSGCGNETASEKEMFRKYMVDSILYWVTEYNIDGFRFDLMGLHDIETMNTIRQVINQIDSRILIYGEGWDMGTGLSPQQKAIKANAAKLPGIGFFNDDQRNAIKGAEVYGHLERGFVSGAPTEDVVAKAVLASDELVPYLSPDQVINYIEAHDNYNVNDLFWALNPDDDQVTHRKRVQLATAMTLLMQGVCFMQIGQEFLRTKRIATSQDGSLSQEDLQRAMNSYNAPDAVNQVDWRQVTKESETVAFVKKLIQLKTKTKLFSYQTFSDIRQHVYLESSQRDSGFISLTVEDRKKYQVIFTAFSKRLQLKNQSAIIVTNDKRFQIETGFIDQLTALVLDITE
ncbi:type I pullulanase [Streptococcus pseudoporcinus]|uniref:pullulanase n=1 Tax=Streptococcus pseudoporcinus LQ 940-04 TaxID=875093 RepID=G5K6P2_9STRE|nr:type I pullulanase [Streptococcus pseudoporcinus]EFR44168.1 pullulanase, type I [Streptococcus pseudoporcinus SPIN 20026]EHI65866.1 pullulanase, type I [Streptococcus pseudoporcinus LQ 940-04]VEF94591.1 pullulanase [Streptococcus pseudoporcinus]